MAAWVPPQITHQHELLRYYIILFSCFWKDYQFSGISCIYQANDWIEKEKVN